MRNNTMNVKSRLVATLVLSAILASPRSATAQRTGHIHGRVGSASGAVIGARVAIEMPARVAIADDRGGYTLRGLPAGHYDVVVTALGYKPARRGVDVAANQSTTLDLSLEQGSLMLSSVVTTRAATTIWKRVFGEDPPE